MMSFWERKISSCAKLLEGVFSKRTKKCKTDGRSTADACTKEINYRRKNNHTLLIRKQFYKKALCKCMLLFINEMIVRFSSHFTILSLRVFLLHNSCINVRDQISCDVKSRKFIGIMAHFTVSSKCLPSNLASTTSIFACVACA